MIWDEEAEQRVPFSHSQKGASSHKCWHPLWLTGVWAAAPAASLLTLGQEGSPLEKDTSFACRMPVIHIGPLGSSWSQKFQWVPAPLAFPLHTHFLPTH